MSAAYRLTAEDERLVRAAIDGALERWNQHQPRGPVTLDAATVDNLTRIGAHAIGCSIHDLRPVELAWIRRTILYPDHHRHDITDGEPYCGHAEPTGPCQHCDDPAYIAHLHELELEDH